MKSKSLCCSSTFSLGKITEEQSVLSELEGNYIDNQASKLMIAIQHIVLIFKLATISATDCAICII